MVVDALRPTHPAGCNGVPPQPRGGSTRPGLQIPSLPHEAYSLDIGRLDRFFRSVFDYCNITPYLRG
jgi:hypothetical protein